jgi:preprotein translocase subunit Sec61beta
VTRDVLPPVADRRTPEGRRRRYSRSRRELDLDPRKVLAAGVAFCGGLVLVFVFFWALGAFDVGNAVAAASVVVLLALVWLAFHLYRSRQEESHDVIRRERERRGF